MKKIFLFVIIVCSFACCKKNSEPGSSSLIGKWKLYEYLADPGDGSGTWHPADPSNPAYLEFKKDGTLNIFPVNSYNSDHYQLTSDSTMIFVRGIDHILIRYYFSGGLLTLLPPCDEPCGERYMPAH